jgi:putative ABC transport system permease protein
MGIIRGPVMKKPHTEFDFDLDNAVSNWIRKLNREAALEDGMIAELEAHLQDEVEDLIEEGKSPEDAFDEATASVESANLIGREYYKTYSHGLLATPPVSRSRFTPALFLNSIKVSLRKMRRQKWYSLISVTGLAVGMACSVLILLWVEHEISYDRFHKNTATIYRVIMKDPLSDSISVHPWLPFPLGPALQNEFPEIAAVSRYRPDDMVVRYKEKAFTETRFLTVDPTFFKIFTFPFLQGNPTEALAEPNSIVIRDTMAKKYFGTEDPIGKVLNLSGRADLSVSSVVHIPDESDFQFDFFFSFLSYPLFNVDLAPLEGNWSGKNYQIYVLLHKGNSSLILEEKISGFLSARTPGQKEVLSLQKLSRIHLYNPDGSDGAMRYIRIFSLLAGFILLIACVNFMNLATARFEGRAKEVALRKMLGGTRGQLIRQFFSESFFHAGAALVVALLLVEFSLPIFNQITLRRLSLDFSHTELIFGFLVIILVVGFVSGLYPALFLSSFAPVRASKVFMQPRGHGSKFRKVLVVFQFALSTMLIIGTLAVKSQISFIMNRNLGMDKENIVYHLMQKKTRDSVAIVRDELLKHTDILSVASCSNLPFSIQSWIGYIDWEERAPDQRVFPAFMSVDHEFIKTVGLNVIEGRDFSMSRPVDIENFIINETARKQIGIKNPIGLELRFWGQRGQVIGVVNDFTNRQMSFTTAPMILSAGDWGASRNYLLMKLRQGNPDKALKHFQQVWEKANPGFPSEYGFLDEAFDRMYTNEKRLSRLLFSFAALAIFISCLGLIGLSSYKAEEKTKEIGIRKVLGASSWKVISLFSLDFARLVIISNAIAWPLGYVVMNRWLQGYAYRTSIGPWMFILAGGLGLLIALLSVGYQTLRAATANPVDSLRYE